jgi:hypothetical protein
MPFTQRKQLSTHRGVHKALGTVQVDLHLPETANFLPSATLPIDIEVRRSCRHNCAFDEIRVRLHEVVSCASQYGTVVTRSTKLLKKNVKTKQKRKTKCGVIDLQAFPLEIPPETRCDSKTGGVKIRHVLEIKLMSRGMGVENMIFKFPFVVGGSQKYKVMPDNHVCYQPTASARSVRSLLSRADTIATLSDASVSEKADSDDGDSKL